MPWVGLPYGDDRAAELKEFYDIRGLPRLVLMDNRGEEVAKDCRGEIYNKDHDETFTKWCEAKQQQEKACFYESEEKPAAN